MRLLLILISNVETRVVPVCCCAHQAISTNKSKQAGTIELSELTVLGTLFVPKPGI